MSGNEGSLNAQHLKRVLVSGTRYVKRATIPRNAASNENKVNSLNRELTHTASNLLLCLCPTKKCPEASSSGYHDPKHSIFATTVVRPYAPTLRAYMPHSIAGIPFRYPVANIPPLQFRVHIRLYKTYTERICSFEYTCVYTKLTQSV